MAEGFVWKGKNGALLNLGVSPRTRNTSSDVMYGESALKVRVASPPTDGRASAEIEGFLAGLFGVAASSIEIVRGASGRDRVALVRGAEPSRAERSKPGLRAC